MTLSGSYQVNQVSVHVDVELQRLRAQVDLFWEKELQRYIAHGLRDGMSIVDAGSGPGYFTSKLLHRFPGSHVTAIEQDPVMTERATAYWKEQGLARAVMVERSILDTGLPESSFDFSIARLLLEHLESPAMGAREILRILKPGGKAVFVDNDFDLYTRTYPPVKSLKTLFEAYCACRESQGGHPRLGRRLPIVLKEAGYRNVDLDVVVAHNTLMGDKAFLESEGMSIPLKLVKEGFLSSNDLAELVKEWRSFLQNEEHVIVRQLFVCVGEK
ncbi:methyltransferase domain-containing protein [Sorangium sp. So ce590]|uniref:methyltransferase domain-containing protein n=1 Tax=Sorangium sp. So ce590 TaxID=3133317 RepID=UPI003F612020